MSIIGRKYPLTNGWKAWYKKERQRTIAEMMADGTCTLTTMRRAKEASNAIRTRQLEERLQTHETAI